MTKQNSIETKPFCEKVLIVVVDFKDKRRLWQAEDMLNEMIELIKSSGAEVVESLICKVPEPNASTLIGKGHVDNIISICSVKEIDTVVFSADLKGSQQRNLEDIIKTKTIDRTQLILDIFAKHATSREGKMQVELAQLAYLLPRLVGKGIELSRLGGGIGTLGPGETKLEIDRRRISEKIDRLRRDLKDVSSDRSLKRKKRQESGIPLISLVGYTNAGKSTLLNALTDAGQLTHDGVFTTLDSLSRQLVLPNKQKVIISDTVGFIHDLPHHLIEAFHATLEEVHEADMLLHVVDVSNPKFKSLYEAVMVVLNELKAQDKMTIVVLNKVDAVSDPSMIENIKSQFDHAVCISAKHCRNIDQLQNMIIDLFSSRIIEINLNVPIKRMDLVNLVHKEGQVYSIKYYKDRINIRASVSRKLAGQLEKVQVK